jgi:hypothetical protein
MTFQAYLDSIEKQTGGSPPSGWPSLGRRASVPARKATPVTDWLKADYKLGHGHAMAIVKLLKDKGVLTS